MRHLGVRDRQLGRWTSPRRVNVWSPLPRPSSGDPFVLTPGEKIQERGPSPCPTFQGVRLFILCFCVNRVLELCDGGGLDRRTAVYCPVDISCNLLFV